ncbi:MAG TPA: hypothetical protein VJ805_13680 [Nitrospiraceae bacterium]|nr:hypothetical protein [Nitrospiraceae bacterium]
MRFQPLRMPRSRTVDSPLLGMQRRGITCDLRGGEGTALTERLLSRSDGYALSVKKILGQVL